MPANIPYEQALHIATFQHFTPERTAAVQAPNNMYSQHATHQRTLPGFNQRYTLLYARFACASEPQDHMGKLFRQALIVCRLQAKYKLMFSGLQISSCTGCM